MKTWLRVLLLAAGLAWFAWFLRRSNPGEIWRTCSHLGWLAGLLLLPYAAVTLVDALGWRFAFGRRWPEGLSFLTLFRVRWCGEAVNNVVPSAYIGGEATKVYLLHKRGFPPGDAAASVIAGRTLQTLAQAAFIALGLAAFVHLTGRDSRWHQPLLYVFVASAAAVVMLFWLQTHGLFTLSLKLLHKLRLPAGWMESRREKLQAIDRQIVHFYRHDRKHFVLSTGAYLAGWLLDATDILLASHLLNLPIHWAQALAIEAFIGVAKILGLFVPGALGVQESGIAWISRLAGAPDALGPAYAVIRRARETIYASLGWLLLYLDEASLKGLPGRVASEISRNP